MKSLVPGGLILAVLFLTGASCTGQVASTRTLHLGPAAGALLGAYRAVGMAPQLSGVPENEK